MSTIIIEPSSWCEHEHRRCPPKCILDSVESRLREAHRRWHDSADAYQSPEDFRDNVSSAIQALRNVTFNLQKQKSNIPGFDEWYKKEQDSMRSDSVLRWVVESRNIIVKEADLDTKSEFFFSVVSDYADEAQSIGQEQLTWEELPSVDPSIVTQSTVEAPVYRTAAEVMDVLDSLDLPLSVRQSTSVVFERQWIDSGMPQHEILTLLAHAYGRLNDVVSRCHTLLGMELVQIAASRISEEDSEQEISMEALASLPMKGRLPCMVSTLHYRTSRFRLSDRTEVTEYRNWNVPYDPGMARAVAESGIYGIAPEYPSELIGVSLQKNAELEVLLKYLSKMARLILQSGQEHGWFSHYYRGGHRMNSMVHVAMDKQGKHVIATAVARRALELNADVVVMISEAWTSPLTPTLDGAYIPPSLHEDRSEVLAIDILAKSGARASGLVPFTTLRGEPPHRQVEIGDFIEQDSTLTGLFAPTMAAWGLSLEPPAKKGAAFWRAQRKYGL
jgi:hypothetical protein